ncbi:MAG: pirin family protein [Candidatus Krumholzibacteriia bacterium]
MKTLRPADQRGHADHGWLQTWHTFSFGQYRDPAHMGFSDLRVINDDRVAAGQGFGTHPHRDMEIITYVLDGALEHRDSLGTGSVLRYGDVQRMTAGRGITHSEFNPSPDHPLHLLQIWILPAAVGLDPGYEERHFDPAARQGRWQAIATPDGADGSLRIHQDTRLHAVRLAADEQVTYDLAKGRRAWLQVARGRARLDQLDLEAGDGVAVADELGLTLTGLADAELLLFDLR